MYTGIHFGSWSLILALGAFQGVVVAALLLAAKRNRAVNRILAALLAISVLRLLPYIIGYAGVYDAYPWLTYAPYNFGLAFGPLVYLYLTQITTGQLPRRFWLYFLPTVAEFIYYACLFPRSTAFKFQWDDHIHGPWIAPAEQALILLSAIVYTVLSLHMYRVYQRRLAEHLSYSGEFRITWLRNFLAAFSLLLLVWAGFALTDRLLHRLSYFDEFPLYLTFTLFTYYLGLEGWRHAGVTYPQPAAIASPVPLPAARDWNAQANQWLLELRTRELWRNPDLTLAILARELGTNTAYLSRALNEGLGQSFSECINRLRIAEVRRILQADPDATDLLTLALEAGFRSKASFNRAFKDYTGQTPSHFRAQTGLRASQSIKIADI